MILVPTAQDAAAGPPKAQLRGNLAYEDLILGGQGKAERAGLNPKERGDFGQVASPL